ncbi:MAG: ATPase, T2SS/T4P/T4SS family [Candidatus Eisenbacteria bacterium]
MKSQSTLSQTAEPEVITSEVSTDDQAPAAGRDVQTLFNEKLKVPSIDLSLYLIDEDVAKSVPERIARKYTLVPVFKIDNNLTIAMADPMDVFAIDEVRAITGCIVEPVQASPTGIENAIQQYFGAPGATEGAENSDGSRQGTSSTGLISTMIARAVKDGASDIHIEPEEKSVRVRQRVDGTLSQVMAVPKSLESSLVTRVKIMSKLDIAEKRLPQDGRIQIKSDGKDVDIRVSIQPTVTGENIVMRILDRASVLLGLEHLGLDAQRLSIFDSAIKKPYGMLLVTGPTGSGKTTTLYSVLNRISSPELNVMTIEDPVEYRLSGIRQTQVNTAAGYTFANGLRALLRQDPDVIMVGEIRDGETAEIAIRAALTGHLVLSTLHTNDASGAFARLADMGAEPFLIASSVHCVLAQRLVRLICDRCKRPVEPPEYLFDKLGVEDRTHEYWHGKGCRLCHQTGYRGRGGIFEVLPMSAAIRDAVLANRPTDDLRQVAQSEGMASLRMDGLSRALTGVTTLEEVLRVTVSGADRAPETRSSEDKI